MNEEINDKISSFYIYQGNIYSSVLRMAIKKDHIAGKTKKPKSANRKTSVAEVVVDHEESSPGGIPMKVP